MSIIGIWRDKAVNVIGLCTDNHPQRVSSSAHDMSHRLSSPTELARSTSAPPRMPTLSPNTLSMSRRKTPVQDENALQSRIPVKSPPRSILGGPTTPDHNLPKSLTPSKKLSVRFDGKPSIPFPKSSEPAPPVVTNPSNAVDDGAPIRALAADLPKPPPLAKKQRLGKVAKGKEKDGRSQDQTQTQTYGMVWKTLLDRGKAVVAQTLDRDRECQGPVAFHGWC